MLKETTFLLNNAEELRDQIQNHKLSGRKLELWNLLKSSVRSDYMSFGWFAPFVAVMTGDKQDIENARQIIFTYVDKLDPMTFCSGLQYHFWCFAFPHAKVCIYYQWLCSIGAFTPEEEAYISERLIIYHFVNFFFGMRTKPEPECVDNQTLSLSLSTTIVGYIFSQGENPSQMAAIMLREGLRRLPIIIGDFPISGYSGEGSAYMDGVIGAAIPFSVEVLELLTGEQELLFKEFAPRGSKPIRALRMVARGFMPGGLQLPWDNYGYQLGVRGAMAYGAKKTGEKLFYDMLEKECIWTYDIGVGWAYDDLVWTLCWWPDEEAKDEDGGRNWFEETVGGTLVTQDCSRYLIQMWDESAPVIPTRMHVNPNAVLFNGFGVPISADGSPCDKMPHSFQFADTWRTVGFMAINTDYSYNYGDGCCGAHSCILVDDQEGMRAYEEYEQFKSSSCQRGEEQSVCADVTPIYQENFKDALEVYRKSSLHCDRFFLIEDVVRFEEEHKITSRFLFRPTIEAEEDSVKVTTPEGVSLYLKNLLGGDEIVTRDIQYHPKKPDGRSQVADFCQKGKEIHRLFLAFISNGIQEETEVTGAKVVADKDGSYGYEEAVKALAQSDDILPMKLPAYMEAELPNHRTWWYEKTVAKKQGRAYLKLPVGINKEELYVNGVKLDLSAFETSKFLIAPRVELPAEFDDVTELTIVFKVDVPVSHYDGEGYGTIGMSGGIWLCYPMEEEVVEEAYWNEGRVYVKTNQGVYESAYRLKDEGK